MPEEKIKMKVFIDERIRKKIWEKAYRDAMEKSSSLRGVFNKLVIKAIEKAIEEPPELEEGRNYRTDKGTTIIIPKSLRDKLLKTIMEKYGTKYGMFTYVINYILDEMLE